MAAPKNKHIDQLGPVLFECARLLDEIAQDEVNRQAGRRLLTPGLVRLLPHLSRAGIRPSELARRVDVTKQAVGQAIAGLSAMRLVELVPDPSDGRARLVRLTEAGEAAYGHGRTVLAFYTGELANQLGASRIADLSTALADVLPILQRWRTGGAPIPAGVAEGSAAHRLPRSETRRPSRRTGR